ncbi:nucleotidyltransferase domain-containing protein [Clostridium sp.]|uniref:nucleotidyltransferase domain-containing protein n=1 Tax=Clostridium sp. TaxID=1506 RepID=UPI002FDCD36A
MFGLLERDLKYILEAVKKYSEIEEVIIFGSRAMGNYKKGSDVDIALKGEYVNRKVVCRLSDDLNEEYPLPYFFDVVNYNDVSNEELKRHIDNVGKTIYKRED